MRNVRRLEALNPTPVPKAEPPKKKSKKPKFNTDEDTSSDEGSTPVCGNLASDVDMTLSEDFRK